MTTNEQILDEYIRHQTYILRYAGGLRNEVTPYLAKTEPKLMDLILAHVARAGENRVLTGAKGRKWQVEFEKALHNVRDPAWAKVSDKVMKEIREFAVNEAAVGATTIEGAVPVVLSMSMPPAAQLVGIVNSQPFEGKVLKKWMEKSAFADVERISRSAKVGIVQGQTPTQIARTIVGPRNVAGKYNNSVSQKAFRDIESVLLTVTNGVQQEAKQALYEANKDIVNDELFVATLDSRTTIECMGNDGKTFPRGEGPIPPLHFRCRSTRVAVMDAKNLGNRPFVAVSEKQLVRDYAEKNNLGKISKRKDLPYGHKTKFDKFKRAELPKYVGTVPATTSYNDWLKGQSKEFQNDVLGPTRAKMFRKGDITLDRFTARNGSTLTLSQLKTKGMDVPSASVAPTKIQFVPAKTVQEAQEWATNNGLAKTVNYKKLKNVDVANAVNERLLSLSDEHGMTFDNIKTVRQKSNIGSPAWSATNIRNQKLASSDLVINGAYFNQFSSTNSLISEIKKLHKRDWWVSESVGDLITHEFGHRLTAFNTYTAQKRNPIKFLLEDAIYDRKGLSHYASSSIDESLAEIFAKHYKGEKMPSEWIDFFNRFSEKQL